MARGGGCTTRRMSTPSLHSSRGSARERTVTRRKPVIGGSGASGERGAVRERGYGEARCGVYVCALICYV